MKKIVKGLTALAASVAIAGGSLLIATPANAAPKASASKSVCYEYTYDIIQYTVVQVFPEVVYGWKKIIAGQGTTVPTDTDTVHYVLTGQVQVDCPKK